MLDGGANINVIAGHSKHIVYNPERLHRDQTFLGIHGKQASENSSIKLNGTGLIWLLGSWVPVYISELMEENIISDGVLTSLGFKIMKYKDSVRVEGANGENVQDLTLGADRRAHFTESAIKIPTKPSIYTAHGKKSIGLDIWHARFGHINGSYLNAMTKFPQYEDAGFIIDKIPGNYQCDHCGTTKFLQHHNHPLSSRHPKPGLLWYTDVAGGGQRTPSLVDECTIRYIFIESTFHIRVSLYSKKKDDSETLRHTEFFITRVLPLFRKDPNDKALLVFLRSDNGEMASSKVQQRLARAGIVSEFTCPYTPEQNGVAERLNRTIDNMAATMLTMARLPEHFWKEASALATLILNVTPWKKDGKYQLDSYSRLTGRVFPYHLLRIFGSKAFVYDTQRDTSNLTARALQGIFCGFAKDMITEVSWAYRIYIPAQHRFIHSGYVQFVETVGRSPEQVLSPIILADLESTVFNVDEWNKALKKTIHFDHEDCTYYVTTRVREYQGLAVVDRLPWPTTKNQRPQTVHLRDVLRMQKISSDQSSGLQMEEIKDDDVSSPGSLPGGVTLRSPGNRGRQQSSGNTATLSSDHHELPLRQAAVSEGLSSILPGCTNKEDVAPSDVVNAERVHQNVKKRLSSDANGGARRSERVKSRMSERHFPRINALCNETYMEATIARIHEWALDKSFSLTPHLITPTVLSLNADEEPSSHDEVLIHPSKDEWIKGELREIESVERAECLREIDESEIPQGARILRLKWVYKIKRDEKGNITLYKCRIVVMGNHAREGIEYFETYSPVCKIASLRLVVALIIHFGLKPVQIDVNTAYLHAPVEEDIYVRAIPGYPLRRGKIYKLLKSLYGLPQAGKNWNDLLDKILKNKLGFIALLEDPCVYILVRNGEIVALFAVYVDDFIAGSKTEEIEAWLIRALSEEFSIKVLGLPKLILGISLDWVPSTIPGRFYDHVYLSIPKSIKAFLDMLSDSMEEIKERSTPGNPVVNLSKEMCPETEEINANVRDMQGLYRSGVGICIWIQQTVRYDISYATHRLSRFVRNPGFKHYTALLWLAGYLKSTMLKAIKYSFCGDLKLEGFVDASHLADEGRTSTWCYVFKLCGGIISWKVGKTDRVCIGGTAESEIRAIDSMKHGLKEMIYLQKVFCSLSLDQHIKDRMIGFDPSFPVVVFEDNQAAIQMTSKPMSQSSLKHLEADINWVYDYIKEKKLKLIYIKSPENLANIGTKYLNSKDFAREVAMSFSDDLYVLLYKS